MRTIEDKTYNPCDECPYGIDMRDGSGNDRMCKICEFNQLIKSNTASMMFRAGITDGISKKRLEELCNAERDGRCYILPDGYEHFEELWHIINCPVKCTEDGNGCDDCRYSKIDECAFKPYVGKISLDAVFKAERILYGLALTREAAEAALGGEKG